MCRLGWLCVGYFNTVEVGLGNGEIEVLLEVELLVRNNSKEVWEGL